MSDNPPISGLPFPTRAVLRTFGLIVFVLGLGSAGIVYWHGRDRSARLSQTQAAANASSGWQDTSLAPEDSKRAARDLEIYYGKVGVLMETWSRWCDACRRPTPLAMIIATLATLVGAGCCVAANRLPAAAVGRTSR